MSFLSIIIPTFNSAFTLNACLQSVLNQDFNDYQIILIDGISSDNTIDIIKEFAGKYQNVTWVSEKDDGIYDAMNKGTRIAKGQWLYFLGSDDYLQDSHVLTDVSKVLKTTNCSIIYGDAVMVSDGSRQGGIFSLNMLLTYNNICHQTIFYKKELFEIIGPYNTKYPIVADWDFNIRCFSNNKNIAEHIDRIICVFNNVTGVSNNSRNDPFYQLIPAPYVWEISQLKFELNSVLNSSELKLGRVIYKYLKKTGIVNIVKMIYRR